MIPGFTCYYVLLLQITIWVMQQITQQIQNRLHHDYLLIGFSRGFSHLIMTHLSRLATKMLFAFSAPKNVSSSTISMAGTSKKQR